MNAKVFLCHSSSDKLLVRRLAIDLQAIGIDVWLDEWAIRVGDSILQRIQEGIHESTFLIACLSADAVKSRWFHEELNAAFLVQLHRERAVVLPILLSDCEMPPFLRDKKYADFRVGYALGFQALLQGIQGHATLPPRFEHIVDRVKSGIDISLPELRLVTGMVEDHQRAIADAELRTIAAYAIRARCSVAPWLRRLVARVGRPACMTFVHETLGIHDPLFEKCLDCAFPEEGADPQELFAKLMGFRWTGFQYVPHLTARTSGMLEIALTYFSLIGSDAAIEILLLIVACTGNWCERGIRPALRTRDRQLVAAVFDIAVEALSTDETHRKAVIALVDHLSSEELTETIYVFAARASHVLYHLLGDVNLWPPPIRRHVIQIGLESKYPDIRSKARAQISPHEAELLRWAEERESNG